MNKAKCGSKEKSLSTHRNLASDDILKLVYTVNRFSVFTHWISGLGETKRKTRYIFNIVILLYSIFNIYFVIVIQRLFSSSTQSIISYMLFGSFSLLLILIPLFPLDTKFAIHRKITDYIFIVIMSGLSLLLLSLQTSGAGFLLPTILLSTTIIVGLLLGYSAIKIFAKYKKIPRTLIIMRRTEKSLFIRNASALEWMFFSLVVVSQFVLLLF